MSTHSNNSQTNLFPTETNIFPNHKTSAMLLKKTIKQDQKNQLTYSSIMYKSRHSSKQKFISPQLQSIINKIQIFVDDIDSKIQNRVQLVKQVYLNEYKEQVVEMSAQLKNLREKLDNQIMKERANEKMFYLEEERDFFRSEVLKLNEQMNRINVENKSLKKLIEQEKRESQNYKKIVYNLESKLLRLKNSNIQRQKMIEAQSNTLNVINNKNGGQKNKNGGSTMDTKFISGSKTQRYDQKTLNSLQAIQNEQQMGRTGYKMQHSKSMKSYQKYSMPQREMMRSTATISYPKLTVQKLEKIQGYSELLQRQNVIDECINQLKKQIYYRNLSIGQKQSKMHFNESSQIKFQSFTKTDKKQLIIKLLSNEKILNDFYQFLFNNKTAYSHHNNHGISPIGVTNQLINNKLQLNSSSNNANKFSVTKLKLTDAKFNNTLLTNMKTQFNKKIFDIKHNR